MKTVNVRSFVYDNKLKTGEYACLPVQVTELFGKTYSDLEIVDTIVGMVPGVTFVGINEVTQEVTMDQLRQYACDGRLNLPSRPICADIREVFKIIAEMKINKTTKGQLN